MSEVTIVLNYGGPLGHGMSVVTIVLNYGGPLGHGSE